MFVSSLLGSMLLTNPSDATIVALLGREANMRKTFFSIGVLALLFIGAFALKMEAGQEENRYEENWHHRDHRGDNMHRHAPVVVAEREFKEQAGSIPLTTLFTPDCNCMYRVTVYTEVPNRSIDYSALSLISWTDEFAQSQTEIVQENSNDDLGVTVGAGGWAEGQFILHSVAKQPIIFSTQTSTPVLQTYNLYIVVEEL
jgi:hypothetical protein